MDLNEADALLIHGYLVLALVDPALPSEERARVEALVDKLEAVFRWSS